MKWLASSLVVLALTACTTPDGPWRAEEPIPPQFQEAAQAWPPGSSESALIAALETAGYHVDRRTHQGERLIGTRPHCAVTSVVEWTMRNETQVETVTSGRYDVCHG